jgi:hypothetical protein
VFLCVPFRNQSENLTNLKQSLREGQLARRRRRCRLAAAVSGRATRVLGVWQGSAAQQAEEMAPDGVRVVSALHTVSARAPAASTSSSTRTCSICGDRRAEQGAGGRDPAAHPGPAVRRRRAGSRSRASSETLTAVLISINAKYKAHAGHPDRDLPDHPHEAGPRHRRPSRRYRRSQARARHARRRRL